MGSYVNENLTSREQVLYEAKVSLWSQALLLTLGVLTLMAGIGLIFIAIAIVRIITTELVLTNQRVFAKTGFISRQTIELKISKIESVSVNQSALGRVFNYGSIVVNGTGGVGTPIPFIKDPLSFKKAVNESSDRVLEMQSQQIQKHVKPVTQQKECPFCAEVINEKAIFCKHCRTALE